MSDSDPYAAPDVSYARETAAPKQEEAPKLQVPSGSVRDVTDWVGEDKERAKLARDAEDPDSPRKGVLKYVSELLGE